jgi:hypothetical protein
MADDIEDDGPETPPFVHIVRPWRGPLPLLRCHSWHWTCMLLGALGAISVDPRRRLRPVPGHDGPPRAGRPRKHPL